MGKDSKQFTLMFPLPLAEALEAHFGAGKQDFIRAAVAEKLARDFGENLSPTLSRANQGKRNDLARLRAALEEVESVVSGGRITDSDLSKIVKKSASLATKTRKKSRS